MLNFSSTRSLAGDAIPDSLTTLSVSWLNNQFKAVAVHRGTVAGTWEQPGEIEGANNFQGFIQEAVRKTGYRGQTVSLLLAHPRLVQQLVDVPPTKTAAVSKVIRRQAEQQKLFPGEAAWTWQTSLSGKDTQRVVLHLFPKPLLDQFAQGCQRNELHLTSVTPASAVLHYQLSKLPLEGEDIALLAAETAGSTTVVVGRGDGKILLARTLPGGWNENAERTALDLNRTILFVNQQYGVVVNSGVWLFGPGAEQQLQTMQRQIQLPVSVSPVEFTPFYWATEAAKLRPALNPNFISLTLQKAPQRRVFARMVGLLTLLVVLGAAAITVFSYTQAKRTDPEIALFRKRVDQLQARRLELQKREEELTHQTQIVKLVIDDRPVPIPSWFLCYMSEACPAELAVTNLHIKHEKNLWKVQVTGTIQATLQPPAPTVFSNSVATFAARLSNGPFHLLIGSDKDAPVRVKASGAGASPPDWFAHVTTAAASSKPIAENQFEIEGVMR